MKKLILIPTTLTALTPLISVVGCGNSDKPTPPVPGNYLTIDGLQEEYNGTVGSAGNTDEITVSRYKDGVVTDVTSSVTIETDEGPITWSSSNKQFEWPGTLDADHYECSFTINYLGSLTLTCTTTLEIGPRNPSLAYKDGLAPGYFFVDLGQPGEIGPVSFLYYPSETANPIPAPSEDIDANITVDFVNWDKEEGKFYWDSYPGGNYTVQAYIWYEGVNCWVSFALDESEY